MKWNYKCTYCIFTLYVPYCSWLVRLICFLLICSNDRCKGHNGLVKMTSLIIALQGENCSLRKSRYYLFKTNDPLQVLRTSNNSMLKNWTPFREFKKKMFAVFGFRVKNASSISNWPDFHYKASDSYDFGTRVWVSSFHWYQKSAGGLSLDLTKKQTNSIIKAIGQSTLKLIVCLKSHWFL